MFTLGVVCSGSCVMKAGEEEIRLKRGDSFVIAAAVESYEIATDEGTELGIVYPGKDMES